MRFVKVVNTVVNFESLVSSGLFSLESTGRLGERNVECYKFDEPHTRSRARIAARLIKGLVERYGLQFIVMKTSNRFLESHLLSHPFLVFNQNRVLLSEDNLAQKDLRDSCKDVYFTGSQLKNPVVCSNGEHVFEEKHIRDWVQLNGNHCPGGNHRLYDQEIRVSQTVLEQITQAVLDLSNVQKREAIDEAKRLDTLRLGCERSQSNNAIMLSNGAKIALSFKVFNFLETASPAALRAFHATSLIPGLSIFAATASAALRIRRGAVFGDSSEPIKAVADIVSGVAGTVPGVGTMVAMAIQLGNTLHDSHAFCDSRLVVVVEREAALEILGFAKDSRPNNTEIQRAWDSKLTILKRLKDVDWETSGVKQAEIYTLLEKAAQAAVYIEKQSDYNP